MDATVFRNDDRGYLAWLRSNPQGFVLNRQKGKTDRVLVLHRARCRQLALPTDSPYAYTGAHFIKVCATSEAPLAEHAQQQGGPLKRCRVCNP